MRHEISLDRAESGWTISGGPRIADVGAGVGRQGKFKSPPLEGFYGNLFRGSVTAIAMWNELYDRVWAVITNDLGHDELRAMLARSVESSD